MIFVSGKDGSMFLMLSEQDIGQLRQGNTKFVDERQTGGVPFNRVVLSLHKTDQESINILQKAGAYVPPREDMRTAEPKAEEIRCKSCDAINNPGSLFEDRCITCWAAIAKGVKPERDHQLVRKVQDGQHRHSGEE